MSIVDKLYQEWAWRSRTGMPSMSDPEDAKLLEEIYKEYGLLEESTERYIRSLPEVSIEELIEKIKERQSNLTSEYIKKLYYEISYKGDKLGEKLSKKLDEKGLNSIKVEIFHLIDNYPGLEHKLNKYLSSTDPDTHVKISDIEGDVVDSIIEKVKPFDIPASFIESLAVGGKTLEGGKGIGAGEALLALFGKKGRKVAVGDVSIEGRLIEVKADGARLGGEGRVGNLSNLYILLERESGVSPQTVGTGYENLMMYVSRIIQELPIDSEDFKFEKQDLEKILKDEFPGITLDLTNTKTFEKSLLDWYIHQFYEGEAKTAHYICVFLKGKGRLYTKEKFREALLNKSVEIKSTFSKSNKYPQLGKFTAN